MGWAEQLLLKRPTPILEWSEEVVRSQRDPELCWRGSKQIAVESSFAASAEFHAPSVTSSATVIVPPTSMGSVFPLPFPHPWKAMASMAATATIYEPLVGPKVEAPKLEATAEFHAPIVISAPDIYIDIPYFEATAELFTPFVGGGVEVPVPMFWAKTYSDDVFPVPFPHPFGIVDFWPPEIEATFGVSPESMAAIGTFYQPELESNAHLTVDKMWASAELFSPEISSGATVDLSDISWLITAPSISEDLVDFPLWVSLSTFPNSFWDALAVGGTVRCYQNGLEIPREIVWCNTDDKTGEMWVKASLFVEEEAKITIVVDNIPNYLNTDSYGRNAVWDNNFVSSYHSWDTAAIDVTGNGFDGISDPGIVNYGSLWVFNGVDKITFPPLPVIAGNVARTTSAFVAVNPGTSQCIWGIGTLGIGKLWELAVYGTQLIWHGYGDGYDTISVMATATSDITHISVSYDQENVYVYINGEYIGQATPWGPLSTGTDNNMIGSGGYFENLQGAVGEPRISNVARSSAWIWAEYNSRLDNFYTVSEIDQTVKSRAEFSSIEVFSGVSAEVETLYGTAQFETPVIADGDTVVVSSPWDANAQLHTPTISVDAEIIVPQFEAVSALNIVEVEVSAAPAIEPPYFEVAAEFYDPAITVGHNVLAADIQAVATLYAPTPGKSSDVLAVPFAASTERSTMPQEFPFILGEVAGLYTPEVSMWTDNILPGPFDATGQFYAPTIKSGSLVLPPKLDATAAHYVPVVASGTSVAGQQFGSTATFNSDVTKLPAYMAPWTTQFTAAGVYTCNLPADWLKFDVIIVGGGLAGSKGGGAYSAGKGGNAGAWGTWTITRGTDVSWDFMSFSGTVGAGGTSGQSSGGATTAVVTGHGTLTANGGAGNQSGQNGQSPGTQTVNGINYVGGAGGTGNGGAGAAPGAGGAGGDGGLFSGSNGGNGAVGRVWVRAYQ